MGRFKIDVGAFDTFAVYRKKRFGWTYMRGFDTRDKALAFYETIKDLPEYLA